jgi:hypothetical protein
MPLPPLHPDEILHALSAYSNCRLSRVATMKMLGIDDVRVLHEILEDANMPLPTVLLSVNNS